MTNEQLTKAHKARPFMPFTIQTADGRQFRVEHPEVLAYAPPSRTVGVTGPDGTFDVIDLLLVTSLDLTPARNGQPAES